MSTKRVSRLCKLDMICNSVATSVERIRELDLKITQMEMILMIQKMDMTPMTKVIQKMSKMTLVMKMIQRPLSTCLFNLGSTSLKHVEPPKPIMSDTHRSSGLNLIQMRK